jgi:hypothetical protein
MAWATRAVHRVYAVARGIHLGGALHLAACAASLSQGWQLPSAAALPPLSDPQVASALASTAAARSGRPLVVAVCGSKGVGKSTFARLLVNTLLNTCPAVGYLDSDCGQPEFTTPVSAVLPCRCCCRRPPAACLPPRLLLLGCLPLAQAPPHLPKHLLALGPQTPAAAPSLGAPTGMRRMPDAASPPPRPPLAGPRVAEPAAAACAGPAAHPPAAAGPGAQPGGRLAPVRPGELPAGGAAAAAVVVAAGGGLRRRRRAPAARGQHARLDPGPGPGHARGPAGRAAAHTR